jgi:hypothetical protein
MIIFKHTTVFWRTAPLTPELNLSSVDIEVGDLIAVHVEVGFRKFYKIINNSESLSLNFFNHIELHEN